MSEWRKKPACSFCRGMDAEEHRKWIAPSPMVRRDAKSILHLLLSAKCRLLVCVGAMVRLIFTPGFSKLRALIKFTTCCGQKECCGVNQLWQLQQSSEVWGSKHAVGGPVEPTPNLKTFGSKFQKTALFHLCRWWICTPMGNTAPNHPDHLRSWDSVIGLLKVITSSCCSVHVGPPTFRACNGACPFSSMNSVTIIC